jgi:hypothetical protein
VDYLSTTPPELLNTIENVLALYDGSRRQQQGGGGGGGGMAGDAASLMNPEVCVPKCCFCELQNTAVLAPLAARCRIAGLPSACWALALAAMHWRSLWLSKTHLLLLPLQVIEKLRELQKLIRRRYM